MIGVMFLLAVMGTISAKQSAQPVTRGALIEGTFIVQNKLREVKETIQGLKKELTSCSLEKEKTHTVLTANDRITRYHCKLKQLIYPWYIDELTRLYEQGQKHSKELEGELLIDRQKFESIMRWVHHLHEKITLEHELLESIFKADRLTVEAVCLKPPAMRNSWFEKPRKAVPLSTALLDSMRTRVSQLRTKTIIANAHVFIDDLVQEVFLDTLSFFKL